MNTLCTKKWKTSRYNRRDFFVMIKVQAVYLDTKSPGFNNLSPALFDKEVEFARI